MKDRKEFFIKENESIIKEFIEIMREEMERQKSVNWIYIFMPDHLHLIFEGKSIESDLWKLITAFKQRTGWLLREKIGNKYKWQKSFYDHIHRKDEDIIRQIKYIAENPMRKNMVADWREYRYIGSLNYDLKEIIW